MQSPERATLFTEANNSSLNAHDHCSSGMSPQGYSKALLPRNIVTSEGQRTGAGRPNILKPIAERPGTQPAGKRAKRETRDHSKTNNNTRATTYAGGQTINTTTEKARTMTNDAPLSD